MMVKEFPMLNEAYFLKEKFRHIVNTFNYEKMLAAYDTYLKLFKDSIIKEYNEFIGILENWREEILNSFLRPYGNQKLSNILTENINGKINKYISISHSIMNFTGFRKRVLFSLVKNIYYSSPNTLSSNALPGKPRRNYKKIKKL